MISDKTSVLFVSEYYPPHIGGVELLFSEIAEQLARSGHKVGVVTCRVPGSKPFEVLNGVSVHRTWVPPIGNRYFFTLFGVFSVLKFGKQYDVFQTTVYNAALPAALAGFLLRKKVFVVVHEVWDTLWNRLPGLSPLTRMVLRGFEKVILSLPFQKYICVSQFTLDALRAYKPSLTKKSQLIHNGVNYNQDIFQAPKKTFSDREVKTVLFYGRPGISKGVEFMIESMNKATNTKLRYRLVLSRDEKKRYELLKDLATNPQIEISPSLPRKELFEAIAEADYVVIPSVSEGFGFAALEACILGKKLLCSNQGSLPEVVYGNVAFFNPWQTSELTHLLNDLPDEASFQRIPKKEFPIEKTVSEYLQLY